MMMNLDLIPPIPAMNTAAVQFLDLLADPKAARKLMDDLVAAHAKAVAAHTEAVGLQTKVAEWQRKLDQDVKDFEKNRAAHSAFLQKTGGELDARHNKADERERDLAGRGTDLDTREAAVTARESAAQRLEHGLAEQKKVLAAKEAAHQRRADRLAQKVALFQQAEAIPLE